MVGSLHLPCYCYLDAFEIYIYMKVIAKFWNIRVIQKICRQFVFLFQVISSMLTWMLNVCTLTFVLRNPYLWKVCTENHIPFGK